MQNLRIRIPSADSALHAVDKTKTRNVPLEEHAENDQPQNIQPPPPTMSLPQQWDLQRSSWADNRERLPPLSEGPSDSGVVLDEVPSLLVEGIEFPGEGSGMVENQIPRRHMRHPRVPPMSQREQHACAEDWPSWGTDGMIALSLLQARDENKVWEAENLQRRKPRVKRRWYEVCGVARASKRAVVVVSRYICAVVRCR